MSYPYVIKGVAVRYQTFAEAEQAQAWIHDFIDRHSDKINPDPHRAADRHNFTTVGTYDPPYAYEEDDPPAEGLFTFAVHLLVDDEADSDALCHELETAIYNGGVLQTVQAPEIASNIET